jgi:hypothetical protein
MFGNFNFFDSFFNNDFNSNLRNLRFNFDETNSNETPTGDVKITTGEDEKGTWEKKEWISPDGSTKMSSYVYKVKETKTAIDKKSIKALIKKAVKDEDYETAAKLKKELDSLDSENSN